MAKEKDKEQKREGEIRYPGRQIRRRERGGGAGAESESPPCIELHIPQAFSHCRRLPPRDCEKATIVFSFYDDAIGINNQNLAWFVPQANLTFSGKAL